MALPVLTIGLVWHSMNSDNLGVGALTVANIDILRNVAKEAGYQAKFIVLGWKDPRPYYFDAPDIHNAPLRLRHLVSPGGPYSEAIRSCDVVFDIGGGDSFTDIYGFKRFFTIWVTKARALFAGKPLILSPQTIGPFNTWWAKPLARYVMNRARFVTSRDAPSTRFLAEMGVRSKVIEATDVAMGLPYDQATVSDGDVVKVGLNVSGLLFNGGYTQSNQFGLKSDYADVIRQLVTWFTEQPNVELHLVGHVQSEHLPVEDDQRVSAQLHKDFPQTKLAPFFGSPSEAKSYISGMDFFVGARMHATIAAFSAGIPVVPMAYSRKFIGVFGTLGYDHVADCKADTADQIISRIQEGFANRAALKAEVAVAMENVEARLALYAAEALGQVKALQK